MLKKTNKQTKQTQESHTKNSISSGLGKKESYPNQITYIPPPPPTPSSTPQKSNGRPLFSQNSESCASFQTRRTRRLVEKNNNNNQNFLRGDLDLQGQCVCKQKKVPLFTKSLL